MENMQKQKTGGSVRVLCECAIMIALAAVLSLLKIWKMRWGGSVTLVSMLPIMLISVKSGTKVGIATAFVYSLVQIALDLPELMGWGMTAAIWAGSLIFDYLLAYTVIGLSAVWKKHGTIGITAGISLAVVLRYVSHVISGCVFFAEYRVDAWFGDFPIVFYSLIYNGCYLLPELVLTLIIAVVMLKDPVMKKLLGLQA